MKNRNCIVISGKIQAKKIRNSLSWLISIEVAIDDIESVCQGLKLITTTIPLTIRSTHSYNNIVFILAMGDISQVEQKRYKYLIQLTKEDIELLLSYLEKHERVSDHIDIPLGKSTFSVFLTSPTVLKLRY